MPTIEEIQRFYDEMGLRGSAQGGFDRWRRTREEALQLMKPAFYDDLEREGTVALNATVRDLIHLAVAQYTMWQPLESEEAKKKAKRSREKHKRQLVSVKRKIEALMTAIKTVRGADTTYWLPVEVGNVPQRAVPVLELHLNSYSDSLDVVLRHLDTDGKGNRTRTEDQKLIEVLAWLYHRAGGQIAYSEDGPFARFLMRVWEALPPAKRCADKKGFARLLRKPCADKKSLTMLLSDDWDESMEQVQSRSLISTLQQQLRDVPQDLAENDAPVVRN